MATEGPADVVRRALAGDPAARTSLVELLYRTVRWEIVRVLQRHAATGRDPNQEVDDLIQEVFCALFADDAKALRAWCPDGGRSVIRFVGWYARHQALAILRSGRRSPWVDDPTDFAGEGHEIADPGSIEDRVLDRDLLAKVLDRFYADATPRMVQMFVLLFVEQVEVEEICTATGLVRGAVYKWRERLKRRIGQIADALESEPEEKDR